MLGTDHAPGRGSELVPEYAGSFVPTRKRSSVHIELVRVTKPVPTRPVLNPTRVKTSSSLRRSIGRGSGVHTGNGSRAGFLILKFASGTNSSFSNCENR